MRQWVVIACVAALPGVALAEGDRALSADVGWATFSAPGPKMGSKTPAEVAPDAGVSIGATYEHSIGSDFSLRGDLACAAFTGGQTAKQTADSFAAIADVGVTFRFDILRDVPYAFGGVGAMVTGGGPIDRDPQLVLVVGGGLDILASRSRSFGIEAKLASFGGDVTVFTLGVRGSIRWGYF